MFAQMRYIKLTGATGVINVGAISDIQQHTDKDTIDDAVLACKSAYENGYVRGMNLEILSILNDLRGEVSESKYNRLGVEYETQIYDMLYKCFYLTSMEVINNKHPDVNERRRIMIIDTPDVPSDNKSHANPIVNLCSAEILDKCISDPIGYDYNLRSEWLSIPEFWSVINSTATDIEILRAVVNVLTTIITSNQFLSVTRRYDSKIVDEKAMQRRLNDERKLMENKVHAIMDTLATNENYDLLQGLLGGVIINGDIPNLEETDDNSEV